MSLRHQSGRLKPAAYASVEAAKRASDSGSMCIGDYVFDGYRWLEIEGLQIEDQDPWLMGRVSFMKRRMDLLCRPMVGRGRRFNLVAIHFGYY